MRPLFRSSPSIAWFTAALWMGLPILCGCATPQPDREVRFLSFEEPQQTWPTQGFGLMHMVNGFPFYGLNQLPPEPYEVLGFVYASGPASAQELEAAVVQRAQVEGGQGAIVTRTHPTVGAPGAGAAEYLIIAFKTNALASVLGRIDVYLALHPEATNRTDQAVGQTASEWENLRQRMPRQSQLRNSDQARQPHIPALSP